MAEPLHQIGVLVADVDAAGIGHLAVDYGDFPVIPVVEVDAVYITMYRIEHLHLNTSALNGLEGLVGQAGQISEIVEDDMDFHAGGHPLFQRGKDSVPDPAFRQNVVFQENIDLRFLEMGDQIVKKRRAVSEIPGGGVAVQQKAPLLKVGGHPSPGRGPVGEPGEIRLAGHPQAFPLGDGRDLPQTELFGLVGSTPQAEQDHARHRQRQQQAHPHQLIAGTAGPLIDPDGDDGTGKLQNAVNIACLLTQEVGQQQRCGDLSQHRQHTHADAGHSGDPALYPFLRIGYILMHGPAPPCFCLRCTQKRTGDFYYYIQ